MRKNLSEKLSRLKPLVAKDLTPAEKEELYQKMVSAGATRGFSYLRFFDKGFDEWELIGTRECKRQFMAQEEVQQKLLQEGNEDSGEDKGYGLVLWTDDPEGIIADKGRFYSFLQHTRGLKSMFTFFMQERGMKSNTTICARFTEDDWKPFEEEGILSIIEDICN